MENSRYLLNMINSSAQADIKEVQFGNKPQKSCFDKIFKVKSGRSNVHPI
jgi:hypothetical protein